MIPDPDQDLILLYVAGLADADETARAEALLSSAAPSAAADYAEALAIYHALPLDLNPVEPPRSVRDAVLARIAADVSSPRGDSGGIVTRLRWPIYVASGLAACLAVALTLGAMNYSKLSERNQQLAATLAGSESVLSSPHVSLASMQTQGQADSSKYGRILFCPVTRRYQVTVFGLPPLPTDKAYELWLITPDGRKVSAGLMATDAHGVATMMAQPSKAIDTAAVAAITVEPATGSAEPTGSIQLVGQLSPSK